LGLGKISVGAPYFNSVFTPIALLLIVCMAVGPLSKWHNTPLSVFFIPCLSSVILSALISAALVYWYDFGLLAWISFTVVFWVVCLSFADWFGKVSAGTKGIIPRARQLPRNYYGMLLAHLGMVVSLVGIVLVSINSQESMLRLSPGESTSMAGYEFRFDRLEQVKGPNYVADRAHFSAYKSGEPVAVLYPEKRLFTTRQQVMTEAALDAGFTRDLYISLGEKLDGSAWGVRIYVKSFVRWIWLGGLMMMVGGLLAALDKRYRRRAE
jgi:cytochrome c-type biogenesis protein CcmF